MVENIIITAGVGIASAVISIGSAKIADKVVKVKEVPADAENPEKVAKNQFVANAKKAAIVTGISTAASIGLGFGASFAEAKIFNNAASVDTTAAETEAE